MKGFLASPKPPCVSLGDVVRHHYFVLFFMPMLLF